MQVYHNIPYGKVVFYIFTIVFHLFLLIRSAVESQYFLAALLTIPVVAVSLVLIKFLNKTLISVILNGSTVELATAFTRLNSEVREIKIEGREVSTQGRKFDINLQKANSLIKAIKESS